jgi:PAS domain S-box-containing protein
MYLNYSLIDLDVPPGVPVPRGQIADGKDARVLLSGIVESAMDAIIAIDVNHRVTIFNAAAEKMFRCSAEEAMGQTIDRFIPKRFRPAQPHYVAAFKRTGTSRRGVGSWDAITIRGLRTGGEEFPAEASMSFSGPAREVVCTFILRDTTERVRAQEALALSAAELLRSNAELERFAYVASHDLKEPLRMVTSYLELLRGRYGGRLDADADEFIDYAVDGATRMRGLIDGLLVYSRLGARCRPFQAIDCDVLLDRVMADRSTAMRESGGFLTRDPLPTVMADAGQLEQLFHNLIANAVKFHGEALPRVHVAATPHGQGGWLFSVSDNGIGIDQKNADRIFAMFERLKSSSEYSGNGIGLAICKKIVEHHLGQIWVESQPGQGSTFYFTVPAHFRPRPANHPRQTRGRRNHDTQVSQSPAG